MLEEAKGNKRGGGDEGQCEERGSPLRARYRRLGMLRHWLGREFEGRRAWRD